MSWWYYWAVGTLMTGITVQLSSPESPWVARLFCAACWPLTWSLVLVAVVVMIIKFVLKGEDDEDGN